MQNPPEPEPSDEVTDPIDPKPAAPVGVADGNAEAATVVFATEPAVEPSPADLPERRFTAPGFDAGKTEILPSMPTDAATRVIGAQTVEPGKATPQQIPPRTGMRLPTANNRSWGWVLAAVLIILVIAVVAVLVMLAMTKDSAPKASQEDRVRNTIHSYDAAVQNGDLATLRSITCGSERDSYVNYDQRAWDDTYRRVAAARQYPQIASVDAVMVTDGHAEANVTAFMAYAPQTRSTRSIDLQYRDDQWKICQSATG